MKGLLAFFGGFLFIALVAVGMEAVAGMHLDQGPPLPECLTSFAVADAMTEAATLLEVVTLAVILVSCLVGFGVGRYAQWSRN